MKLALSTRHLVLVVLAVFFVAGSILTVISLFELAQALRLRREGRTVEAVVVDKELRQVTRKGNRRTEHVLRLRFQPEGGSVEGRAVVDAAEWERRAAGDRLAVRYLPGAPDVHRLADGKELESPLVGLALGLGIGSVFGALLGRRVVGLRREWRLAREGTPAEGVVLAVEPAGLSVNRVAQGRIRYRYQDHLGRTHEGDSGAVPPAEVEGWKAGDAGTVRFDRARPRDSVWMERG